MSKTMVGSRREQDTPPHIPILAPGEYMLVKDDQPFWVAAAPNGWNCNLRAHDVTEHEDGTITVSPSILITRREGETWHGYLEHGVWREC